MWNVQNILEGLNIAVLFINVLFMMCYIVENRHKEGTKP